MFLLHIVKQSYEYFYVCISLLTLARWFAQKTVLGFYSFYIACFLSFFQVIMFQARHQKRLLTHYQQMVSLLFLVWQ